MIRTIIVDDEAFSRKNIVLLLQKYCSETVEIIGESDNVNDACALITTLQPSLVFLDIEIGYQTGFDVLAKFPQPTFRCIFITAFDQYALKAIKFCALDYILKPVDHHELQQAVAKATTALQQSDKTNMHNLIENLKKPNHKTNKITIPIINGFKLLAVENILYMEADKDYTFIHCTNNQKLCSTTGLGEYEDILADYSFFRTHHSYIINKDFVTDYIKGDGGEIVLHNGKMIPVSRRKKQSFLDWLGM